MKALVFAEHSNGKLKKIAFENVSLAKKLGLDFVCVVIGNEIEVEHLISSVENAGYKFKKVIT